MHPKATDLFLFFCLFSPRSVFFYLIDLRISCTFFLSYRIPSEKLLLRCSNLHENVYIKYGTARIGSFCYIRICQHFLIFQQILNLMLIKRNIPIKGEKATRKLITENNVESTLYAWSLQLINYELINCLPKFRTQNAIFERKGKAGVEPKFKFSNAIKRDIFNFWCTRMFFWPEGLKYFASWDIDSFVNNSSELTINRPFCFWSNHM